MGLIDAGMESKENSIVCSLKSQKRAMIGYLNLKVMQEDWHGVADAAMDLRELEAKLSVLK